MKKNILLFILISIFAYSCSQNEVIRTHGVAYLDKREKLIIVNQSNKNDAKKGKFDWLKKLNIFSKSESKKKDDKNK